MELHVINKPNLLNFSGNTMPVSLAIAPYGAYERAQNIQILISIEMADGNGLVGGAEYREIYSDIILPNNNGVVAYDIRSIVNAHLQYHTPRATLNQIIGAPNQSRGFRVSAILQRDGVQIDIIRLTPFHVIKGGLSNLEYNRNFYTQHFDTDKKPLSFYAEKEIVTPDQKFYMFFMSNVNTGTGLRADVKIWLENNTIVNGSTAVSSLLPIRFAVYLMPAGYNDVVNMLSADIGAPAIKYSITIKSGDEIIVSEQVFHLDHRNSYNNTSLMYRNSLGGLDSIFMRGEIEAMGEYEMQTASVVPPPAGVRDAVLQPQIVNESNLEQEKFSGFTGFISIEKLNLLRSLFLSPAVFEVKNNQFIPAIINKKSVKFYKSTERLFSLQIEWARALLESFYTPSGTSGSAESCPALISLTVVQVTKNTCQILWQMPEPYDVLELEISNGTAAETIVYTLNGNNGSEILEFNNPAEAPATATITVKGRVICDAYVTPPSMGPVTEETFTARANTVPVATDDVFTIPVGYSSAAVLTGNVLDNDYDPDYDAIEVVAATGSTTQGGTYSITAAGVVTYTPPSASYVGEDTFTYTVREVADASATATAIVRILVGNTTIGNIIYAKMEERNSRTILVDFLHTTKRADFYVTLWADPLCTIPKDVTNAEINVEIIDEYSLNMGSTFITAGTSTSTRVFSGTEKLVYSGVYYTRRREGTPPISSIKITRKKIQIAAHTTGPAYIVV
ncbi:MAG TPA: Ig-like domain-containing protein [Ferruginibacter sp.]|nr:Ig-like domain-containing protein [Ferruginibacter sp.]HRQ20521.1 Ig-like domain-containing protein [Ferruginibacter sp.]